MQTLDFFRARIDAMIDLRSPGGTGATPAVGGDRGRAGAQVLRQDRPGEVVQRDDLVGPSTVVVLGGGRSNAGRPPLPVRLRASLLYVHEGANFTLPESFYRSCIR